MRANMGRNKCKSMPSAADAISGYIPSRPSQSSHRVYVSAIEERIKRSSPTMRNNSTI